MVPVETNSAGTRYVPAFMVLPTESTRNQAAELERSPPDCGALTERMARGEEAAFHEFHRLYFDRLLRYLLVITHGNEETTREALQLTFVRVARHVRRFDSEPDFWKWLAVLARSSVTDEQRKRSRYQAMLMRFFEQRPVDENPDLGNPGEHLSKLLQDELGTLPAEERALLERKYLQRESVRDLATEWQLTEKALESRLLRIRRKLKTAVFDRLKHETAD